MVISRVKHYYLSTSIFTIDDFDFITLDLEDEIVNSHNFGN